ncbi:MAG: hypothetical protein KZQ83_11230 [gamma proteobacterium symbiont of Taylorina sp.]|nr:hypothetical protein [gamma proteobacterium symbiont of Taylorina sp.]
MNILIVDDSKVSRNILRDLLEALGHSIIAEAINGEDGISKFKEFKPEIIIAFFIWFHGTDIISIKQPVYLLSGYVFSECHWVGIILSVAANGSGSTQIQAIKTLNEMRFNNQVVEVDTRSEVEIRTHIESLIEEYRVMPEMA